MRHPPDPTSGVGVTMAASDREPRLASSVIKIMALSRQPSTTPADLERHIVSDAPLRDCLLRLASSAFFGLPRRIDTVSEAIVVLGFNRIQNLAMVYGFSDILKRDLPALGFTKSGLLQHSIAVGVCARSIALRAWNDTVAADQLLIAGLVHELPLLYRAIADIDKSPWKYLDPARKATVALQWWCLDQDVIDIVRFQRAPRPPEHLRSRVAALRIAEGLAIASQIGIDPAVWHSQILLDDLEAARLAGPAWDPLRIDLLEQIDHTVAALCGILNRSSLG